MKSVGKLFLHSSWIHGFIINIAPHWELAPTELQSQELCRTICSNAYAYKLALNLKSQNETIPFKMGHAFKNPLR